MELIGYLVGLLVGVIMGLLGGGGSLLLPVMLFKFHPATQIATAHTTILVGITALFGLIPRWRKKLVDWPSVLALGIPVSLGMLFARFWLIQIIPDTLTYIGSIPITKRMVVLFPFVIVLLLSYATMVGFVGKNFRPRENMRNDSPVFYYSLLVVLGFLIGAVPGIAGAGGGVLIVPLLVIMFGLPIKTVVGTSLAIVTMKSFVGFTGDIYNLGPAIKYDFLATFSILMIVGALIGSQLSNKVDADKLKKMFAWFILSLAVFITAKEIFTAVIGGPTVVAPTPVESEQPNTIPSLQE